MHHEQLIIVITICNKAILVPDLVKIRKIGAKLYANEQQHDIAIYGNEVYMMVIKHEQESWQ